MGGGTYFAKSFCEPDRNTEFENSYFFYSLLRRLPDAWFCCAKNESQWEQQLLALSFSLGARISELLPFRLFWLCREWITHRLGMWTWSSFIKRKKLCQFFSETTKQINWQYLEWVLSVLKGSQIWKKEVLQRWICHRFVLCYFKSLLQTIGNLKPIKSR